MLINGTVRKQSSNSMNEFWNTLLNPIPFIEIYLDNLETDIDERICSRSDLFGNFIFNVPDGIYELRIQHPQYEPYNEIIPKVPNIRRDIYLRKNII